jgi:hypothetical protein
MASIEIRRTMTRDNGEPRQSFDMKVETLNATDMPTEVFVFQAGVAPVRTNQQPEPTDYFISIADPVDLEELPIGSADPANGIPFYRETTVFFRARCLEDLDEAWNFIQEDVQGLVDALNTGLDEVETEDITFS